MEAGFGADFGDVRVHTDPRADQLNTALQATAFTKGSDIYFRSGAYQPDTSSGRSLIAHELAHTVQQGTSRVQRSAAPIRRALAVQQTNWKDATSISATSITQGQTGVFFLKDKSDTTLVVKAVDHAGRAAFGNDVIAAAGAEAVNQRVIPLASPEGQQLLKVMQSLASKYRKKNKTAKGQNPIKLKIQKQLLSGANDSVMIMEAYQNLSNLEELQESDDLQGTFALMLVNGFYDGLGRIHAADMMMGNEDRLEKGHMKNIFVNLWSGQSIGLDTDVRAVSFDQVTKGLDRDKSTNVAASNAPSLEGHQYKDFVAYSIQGRTAKKKYTTKKGAEATGVMGNRGGDMPPTDFRAAVDAAKINAVFDQFIDVLINQAEIVKKDDNVTFLKSYDWTVPRAQFARGIDSGMTALLKNVGDLTGKAEALGQQHGANAAFDPRVFKIRAMYANLRRSGIAEAESMEVLELYAEHLVKGGTEDSFEHWVRMYVLERAKAGAATTVTPTMPAVPRKPVRRPVIKARPRGKLATVGQ